MSEGNFEAVISGRRESSSGIFITLQVNPADVTPDLAMLRVGASLMIGWAEVVDATIHRIEVNPAPEENHKERKSFASLPLVQQIGIRCSDPGFQAYIVAYSQHVFKPTEDNAAIVLREWFGVKSRADITDNDANRLRWAKIEQHFQAYLTDKRYADVKR